MPNRRNFLKQGAIGGGALALGSMSVYNGKLTFKVSEAKSGKETLESPVPAGWQPFTVPLPLAPVLPSAVLEPPPGTGLPFPVDGSGAQVGSDAVQHGIAPEFFDPRFNLSHPDVPMEHKQSLITYKLTMDQRDNYMFGEQYDPVEMIGYMGFVPGHGLVPNPTIIAKFKQPVVVRHTNMLKEETSVHLHGGHTPAHSDGFPDFYVLQNQSRDYFYTNFSPRLDDDLNRYDNFDVSEAPSTMWYHDHGMDITAYNAARGLAGFYLVTDEIERNLMDPSTDGGQVLPNLHDANEGYGKFDIPLALVDQQLNQDGTLHYDFLDHNGRLGDIFTVNGVVQPVFKVQRRKYRFRLLNASNARWYTIRLSTKQPFLLVASDTWMLPEAQSHKQLTLANANRRDIIVDFTDAPDELFLENIMEQTDGRGPKGINPKEKVNLLKFIVEGNPVEDNLVIAEGTPLRPHVALNPEDAKITREFKFNRSNGAWQINDKWFSPRRADAVPALGQTERWILKNGGGGWAHPIHIHLSGFQVQSLNGRTPPKEIQFNNDTVALDGGDEAEILIRFSTFTGPFALHCHILEHEDMRMMSVFDPQPEGVLSPCDGVTAINPMISGVAHHPEGLFGDKGPVDIPIIQDQGVGIPHTDFTPGGGGVAPSPAEVGNKGNSGKSRNSGRKRNSRKN